MSAVSSELRTNPSKSFVEPLDSIWLRKIPLSNTLRRRVLSVPRWKAMFILTMSCGSSKEYSTQHPPSPSTSLPLHDQRELASRLLSRVFSGVQPSGLQPEPDVLSSNAEASTVTVVRSAASTRAAVHMGVKGGGIQDGHVTQTINTRDKKDISVSCGGLLHLPSATCPGMYGIRSVSAHA